MWDKVYGNVREVEQEFRDENGIEVKLDIVSFRLAAEINGRVFVASHVVLKADLEDFPIQYGYILDEMVEFIEKEYAKPRGSNMWQGPS